MSSSASDLAHRLAREAEAVCRQYLSNGRRVGRYWIVGDVRNAPGRSMYVRLFGPESGKGAAGKWTDSATSEHGDLLDVIRERLGLIDFRDVADEARRFLSLPRPESGPQHRSFAAAAPTGSPEAARRLVAASQPIHGTLVESYLRHRCIDGLHDVRALRYHPRCYHRPEDDGPTRTWPAMIASVTDLSGLITGAQRTWLDPSGTGKAPIQTPRKAMGSLLGNAVRFGLAHDVMGAGEGIETMLSLRMVLPGMSMMAALSAAHLSAILFPDTLRRLYIARDIDPAGDGAMATLTARATAAGIEAIPLSPRLGDFNEDLVAFGLDGLRALVRPQIAPTTLAVSFSQGRPVGCDSRRVWSGGTDRLHARGRARPSRGRSNGRRPGPATVARDFLPLAALRAAIPRAQESRAHRPPLCSGRRRCAPAVQARCARREGIAGRPRWARPHARGSVP